MRQYVALRVCRLLRRHMSSKAVPPKQETPLWASDTFQSRVESLKSHAENAALSKLYPRITNSSLVNGLEKIDDEESIQWTGRVSAVRKHGKHLAFVDVLRNMNKYQVQCNAKALSGDEIMWKRFTETIQQGDFYSFRGQSTTMKDGSTGLKVDEIPQLLAPSLHQRPKIVTDHNITSRFPQLELDQNHEKLNKLRIRHLIEQEIRKFMDERQFVHVYTPILAADTGGAIAGPFITRSNYASDHQLFLRIAPELELKKLVAAGMEKVYEIGPSFRNEGLDATHNPEFYTCEFYQSYATLDDLISMTEQLFKDIAKRVASFNTKSAAAQPQISTSTADKSFQRLPFLSSIQEQLRVRGIDKYDFTRPLNHDSWKNLVKLFPQLGIPQLNATEQPKTSHVLDILSSYLLEPLCKAATVITDYPAIMSPLAKSYICTETGQELAARAELFINGTEYANMYEEENDPFAQARKFLVQKLEGEGHESSITKLDNMSHDDVVKQLTPAQRYYIRVLEMGLPPTGGWGCGIDRLAMLFTRSKRIGDVLPFGNLRNVIAMGT